MRHGRIRSSFDGKLPPSASTDRDMRDRAEVLWRVHGIVVIWPDQQLPWDMRAMAENAARRLYGEKVKADR